MGPRRKSADQKKNQDNKKCYVHNSLDVKTSTEDQAPTLASIRSVA